ncbi:hypothetical protein D3C87_1871970 [compost metagenome]
MAPLFNSSDLTVLTAEVSVLRDCVPYPITATSPSVVLLSVSVTVRLVCFPTATSLVEKPM